jgi:hypothetical protein
MFNVLAERKIHNYPITLFDNGQFRIDYNCDQFETGKLSNWDWENIEEAFNMIEQWIQSCNIFCDMCKKPIRSGEKYTQVIDLVFCKKCF